MMYTCPVCGCDRLDEPPYREGLGSDDICPCCRYQFGVTDLDEGVGHDEWRARWIANGMRWEGVTKRPFGWDPRRQLENIGFTSEIGLNGEEVWYSTYIDKNGVTTIREWPYRPTKIFRPENGAACAEAAKIRRDAVFEALGDYLVSFTDGEYKLDDPKRDLAGFVFEMQLRPSGISRNPAFTADFKRDAPEFFCTVSGALSYCAELLCGFFESGASRLAEIPAGVDIGE